ncbi:hypothetical protein ABIA33_002267 [Streptacidiphilus sp. MAP12-16]|jgi:hypothetical protein|uniref:hypothetical protein n=1 Tax=Streptacidiphilus sp. MAP12-16 TaxID=3156300 RepID=UPI00351428DC
MSEPIVFVGPVVKGPPPYRPVLLPGPTALEASSLDELERHLARAGLRVDLDDPAQVSWDGGGREVWVTYQVEVSTFIGMVRYRQVKIERQDGTAFWEPIATQAEFEGHVRRHRPDVDLADPLQVYWADHPGEWSQR